MFELTIAQKKISLVVDGKEFITTNSDTLIYRNKFYNLVVKSAIRNDSRFCLDIDDEKMEITDSCYFDGIETDGSYLEQLRDKSFILERRHSVIIINEFFEIYLTKIIND